MESKVVEVSFKIKTGDKVKSVFMPERALKVFTDVDQDFMVEMFDLLVKRRKELKESVNTEYELYQKLAKKYASM